jgi:hypothetical protein
MTTRSPFLRAAAHSPVHRSGGPLLLLLFTGLLLAASLLALTACGSSAAPAAADPVALYRPALKPEFQSDLDGAAQMPRYTISATVDVDALVLTGTAQIVIPNTSPDPWPHLVFRLYPMLEHYGGNLVVMSALVNSKPGTFDYTNDNTALRVDLDRPLLPKQSVTVQLSWRLDIPQWADQSSVYALFGRSQEMLSLPLFYPSLAVYQPGPAVGSGRWWLLDGSERGDSAFNVASLFAVTLTLPADWVPVTSGTLVTTTLLPAGPGQTGTQTETQTVTATATALAGGRTWAQHIIVTGPSREFMLHASPLFAAVSGEVYGTRVTSYYLPGQEAAGKAALKYAQQALAIYSDRFGEYPFTDMRVAPAPTAFRGMEYPQLMLLGIELYTRFRANLELLAAHEMAHQWWYNIVHNDPVSEPWLDEALAEYSMKIYMEAMRGEDDAGVLQVQRWQTPLDGLKGKGQDTPVNQPVASFLNGTQYETIVYGKGALFYDLIRDAVGTRRFDRFLHAYLQAHRWGIVDTDEWLAALADLPDPTLGPLFQQWIAAPAPQVSRTQAEGTPTPAVP